jgi:hypothetical protein
MFIEFLRQRICIMSVGAWYWFVDTFYSSSVYGLFKYQKFEALTVPTMKTAVFWDVTPYILLEMYKISAECHFLPLFALFFQLVRLINI